MECFQTPKCTLHGAARKAGAGHDTRDAGKALVFGVAMRRERNEDDFLACWALQRENPLDTLMELQRAGPRHRGCPASGDALTGRWGPTLGDSELLGVPRQAGQLLPVAGYD